MNLPAASGGGNELAIREAFSGNDGLAVLNIPDNAIIFPKDEDGTGYIEFPTSIIGDSLGNVLVISRLEDHYDYGNVEVSGEINWAIPKKLLTAEGPVRELWTPIAPLWMIITLIIMLSGVWGHYIYAIIQLIKIRRSKN